MVNFSFNKSTVWIVFFDGHPKWRKSLLFNKVGCSWVSFCPYFMRHFSAGVLLTHLLYHNKVGCSWVSFWPLFLEERGSESKAVKAEVHGCGKHSGRQNKTEWFWDGPCFNWYWHGIPPFVLLSYYLYYLTILLFYYLTILIL